MSTIARYELVLRSRGMENWQDIEPDSDGDYVRYADHVAAVEAADYESARQMNALHHRIENQRNTINKFVRAYTRSCEETTAMILLFAFAMCIANEPYAAASFIWLHWLGSYVKDRESKNLPFPFRGSSAGVN